MSHQWLIQWATSVLLAGATFGLGLAVQHRKVPRWCAWLGMISYSVYLLHPLVFDAYRSVPALHRPHTLPVQGLMFAGCVAVIIGLSAVTYYLVERPMQRLGRRLSAGGGGSGAASPRRSRRSGRQLGRAGGRPDGYATGAAAGSGSAATGAGSGRDTDSDRPGAPTAARSASSSSAVAGGSGASP